MSSFFFFNDTATTEIYTLSLHDALPISVEGSLRIAVRLGKFKIPIQDQRPLPAQLQVGLRINAAPQDPAVASAAIDRKSTRLNSSHGYISYAVFCLKKKRRPSTSASNSS